MSTTNHTEVSDGEDFDDESRFTAPKKLLFESSLWVACPESK